jgi:phage terminase large subunit GpA-like protein
MLDVERYLGRLEVPSYPDPGRLAIEALPSLRPPRRITVPDWAENERRIRSATYNGPWRNSFAPYMVEPARMTTSRRYRAVGFVGPARAVKSDALVMNVIGHRIACMPRAVKVICPTQDAARQFSREKISPMIRATPAVHERFAKVRNADNLHDKLFEGNMSLRIAWPVIGELSMLDIADVIVTDYDRIENSENVDGEGSLFDLALKRTQNFGSLGMAIFESSPGRPVLDADWKPATPHEAPPCTGILSIYNRGTRGRYYWQCPHCHEPFQPIMDALRWEQKGTPGESAKTVAMVCPEGHVIGPDWKAQLNQSGFWLHETGDGQLAEIDDSSVRDTDTVSYWCEGPIAAIQSWEQLALREEQAREALKRTGDEGSLKATVTLDQGRPYKPQAVDLGEGLDKDTLKALAKDYPLGIAPAATRFLTVAVDVQSHRFVVHVHAWGHGLEKWLIDRMEIVSPPTEAPGADKRAIDPPRYLEDWDVLSPLLEKTYRVEGTGYGIRPIAQVIDSGGEAGVTKNAYAYLRKQRKLGNGRRVFLSKGQGGLDRDRARYGRPEKILQQKAGQRSDIRLVYLGTDKLKDEVTLSLTRMEPGPGSYHLSKELDDCVFAEFCAEIRNDDGWEKRQKNLPNEALDLAVMSKGLVIVMKGERINWDRPPAWAAPMPANSNAVANVTAAEIAVPTSAVKARPATPTKTKRRSTGFVSRRF